ncbi:uncharacterized protein LOC142355387 [Convolutriloba macropyga]|uniref:uncharacterized protein LOC142355387 n=1 Tax=Convolutriloba macropyga TaxID=536237 RepID=UPI003F52277E
MATKINADNVWTSDLLAEVGDFSRFTTLEDNNNTKHHRVVTWYTVPGYRYAEKPINDVAILRLADPIEERWRRIPLCWNSFDIGTKIATCGMGTKNRTVPYFPLRLLEAYLVETKHIRLTCEAFPVRYIPPREPVAPCPDDVICTQSIIPGSNICYKDEGSPLYVVNSCADTQWPRIRGSSTLRGQAKCLYGVASYFQSRNRSNSRSRYELNERCNDGSFFARIQPHIAWINRMMMLYS